MGSHLWFVPGEYDTNGLLARLAFCKRQYVHVMFSYTTEIYICHFMVRRLGMNLVLGVRFHPKLYPYE